MLNGHGDDGYNYRRQIVGNFSSNILKKDLTALKTHLFQRMDSIGEYPDPEVSSLREMLAKRDGVRPANVSVTNGATEAIYLIAQTFAEKTSTVLVPTFREYEDACAIHRHSCKFASSLEGLDNGTDLFWLCHPNNPSGIAHDVEKIRQLIKSNPKIVFVIDQSYAHYTKSKVLDTHEAVNQPNVILIHSMTKEFSVPGLRLGYFTANENLVDKISGYRMPWSVNQLAIEAGKYLLSQEIPNEGELDIYLEETKRFKQAIGKIKGVETFPSNTNFFLCQLTERKASELKSYLAEQHGLLIRDASNFRGLDEHFFRLATQTRAENEQLINAIKQWMQ
jgi:threonine-phosphate decarboxylase